MFQNKIRKAATTIVIALTLVGAAVSTADATKKGQNQPNAAAKRQLCADLKLIMETNQDEAKAQWEAGNAAAASEADANATSAYNDARHQGCRWAARVAPPDSDLTVSQAPPPVGVAG
jgi:TPR repeat protein